MKNKFWVDAAVDVFEAMAGARGLVVRCRAVAGLHRREEVLERIRDVHGRVRDGGGGK